MAARSRVSATWRVAAEMASAAVASGSVGLGADDAAIVDVAFDRHGDLVHHGHGFDRILAGGAFGATA